MRGFYLGVFLVCTLGVSEILGASKERDHNKKKTLLKHRSEISTSTNETVHGGDSLTVNGTESEGTDGQREEFNVTGVAESSENSESSSTIATLRFLLKRVLDMIGWSSPNSQRRKDKILDSSSSNSLSNLGAILGENECYKIVACRAGRFLKEVKGKEVIIVILERFTPENWTEIVRVIKEGAIYKDPCQYKCLED